MVRKGYPFNKRSEKKMTNLVSGLLTGVIFAPFVSLDSTSNYTNDTPVEPVSKKAAKVLIIIGIALAPLFIPIIVFAFDILSYGGFLSQLIFFAIIFFPLMIWGGIIYTIMESFKYHSKLEKSESVLQKKSRYDKLIETMINEVSSSVYSDIREDYYNTVKSNIEIEKSKKKLNKEIFDCKKRIKYLGFIPFLKHRYTKSLRSKFEKVSVLEKMYQCSTIEIKDSSKDRIPISKIRGEVFLLIDKEVEEKSSFNFDKTPHFITKKKKYFFKINEEPIESIQFKNLEICIYDEVVLFMTKNDFATVGKIWIKNDYQTILIHSKSSKYSFKRKPIGLIFYEEIGIIEIKILSQRITLLFSDTDDGEYIHNLLSERNSNIRKNCLSTH